jgi:type III pantothenate kinase
MSKGPNIVAIDVGNTTVHAGLFVDGRLEESFGHPSADTPAILERLTKWWKRLREEPSAAVLMASVDERASTRLASLIEDQLRTDVYRVGEDVPAPIGTRLDPETITGIDRLLNAAAAFDTLQQACVVVDAGTAVTVDFVDGHGTFHGGAIAPGVRMQLKALHEGTAALPELTFEAPADEAFGRSTAQAMLQGVFYGVRGLIWKLVEQYAEHYGAFPTVIATGGDAETLFRDDELVERIVPELTLLGIAAAARHALATPADDD